MLRDKRYDRPKEAVGKRLGDWEMDLVIGKEQKSQVLTLFERSQSFFLQTKLPSKKPSDVSDAVIRLLHPYRKQLLTITTDNESEFMGHKKICKALDYTVYFADPYCSGQKGGVENVNKIFREYFPKGTDFREVDKKISTMSSIRVTNFQEKNWASLIPKESSSKEFFNFEVAS